MSTAYYTQRAANAQGGSLVGRKRASTRTPRRHDPAFGQRLVQAMETARIRPAELARLYPADRVTVSKWRGGYPPNDRIRMARLAELLGVSADWLATGKRATAVAERAAPPYNGGMTLDRMHDLAVDAINAKARAGEPIMVSEAVGWVERLYYAGKAEAERAAISAVEAAEMKWRMDLAAAADAPPASQRPPRVPPKAAGG